MQADLNQVLTVLRKQRRRRILYHLWRSDIETQDEMVSRLDPDLYGTEVELIHTDLPMLSESGYIEWDPETGELGQGPRFESVAAVLELFDAHADDLPFEWP